MSPAFRGLVLAEFDWSQIRYSLSWKAYCFSSNREESLWREGADGLSTKNILDVLEAALRKRGLLNGPRPGPTDLALLLVDTFVQFPPATN